MGLVVINMVFTTRDCRCPSSFVSNEEGNEDDNEGVVVVDDDEATQDEDRFSG